MPSVPLRDERSEWEGYGDDGVVKGPLPFSGFFNGRVEIDRTSSSLIYTSERTGKKRPLEQYVQVVIFICDVRDPYKLRDQPEIGSV